jgi:SAM-dependent methyltransferase
MPGSPFDALAEEYDAGRPAYPDSLYEALEDVAGPLAGRLVVDGGAGTGIATRQLAGRGARTVAFDIGEQMLRRAQARSPGSCFLLADGNAIPLRDRCADLACFAQSWHWFDAERAIAEVARVLRPGGYWAAWWNHEWADGEEWFDADQALLESACPGYDRGHRDPAWADERIARTGQFEPGVQAVVAWTRTLSIGQWMTYERSKSYVGGLGARERDPLLARIADLAEARFPDGQMSVPYRTRLRLARRRLSPQA